MDDKNQKKQSVAEQVKKGSQPKAKVNVHDEKELIKKELEECKRTSEDYKAKYLRALADYQNYENRMVGEKELLLKSANSRLLLRILPFLDSLDKAEVFIKDEGLKIVKESLTKALTESGLEEIQVLNREYDPYTAEVIDIVEGEKDNMVIEVLRKGYKFHDRILRVAQVKVSKKPVKN